MRVVCAIDGSKHSRWALDALQLLAFARCSDLVLVHAIGPSPAGCPQNGATLDAMMLARNLAENAGKKLLAHAEEMSRPHWARVETRLVHGDPAEALMIMADSGKVDLIVMGSRGLTDIRRFLLGSVSRKVVMHASCAVLLVKKRLPGIRRIVMAVDGSKEAQRALEFLLDMSFPKTAHVDVVSVVPPLPIEGGIVPLAVPPKLLEQIRVPLEENAQNAAKQAAEILTRVGFDAVATVLHGHPSHEIVKLAEAQHADLLVLGSRGLTGATRFLMGSVSDGVVKYARCNVLVYRS
jgi:nucleotide-binding universal stress UspA family protein